MNELDPHSSSSQNPLIFGLEADAVGDVHEGLRTTLVDRLVPGEEDSQVNVEMTDPASPLYTGAHQVPLSVGVVALQVHGICSLDRQDKVN